MKKINSDFTIEDIHNIRENNHEENKELSDKQIIKKTKDNAAGIINKLKTLKKESNTYQTIEQEPMMIWEETVEYNSKKNND